MNRRHFLTQVAAAAAASSLSRAWASSGPSNALATHAVLPRGKAEHCIFIWLGGGMSQIDTFDPKRRGNSKSRPTVPGTDYEIVDTAVPGVKFTEPMSRSARLAEHITAVRTVRHNIGEHGLATNFIHTGRAVSGSTIYPSFGSIIAHERGKVHEKVPAYLLIGYPNVSRGPGFLGPRHGYIYLTDTETGPVGFSPTEPVAADRNARRQSVLQPLQERAEDGVADYAAVQREALRLAGPEFMRTFNLADEPAALRQAYGGEFGQRCLLSRRLVETGVRFIEVSHNLNFINGAGWDTHNPNILQSALLANGVMASWLTRLSDDHGLTQLVTENQSLDTLIDRLFLRLLTRHPSAEERASYRAMLAPGYEKRLVPLNLTAPSKSKPRVRTPYVSWYNHLDIEANVLRLKEAEAAARGDPPTERLDADWRARFEDVVWALINAPEWTTLL